MRGLRCIKYDECKELIYPDDPESPKFQSIGRYLPSLCDACYAYAPSVEPLERPSIIQYQTTLILDKKALELQSRISTLEDKLKELTPSKRKRGDYY